MLGLQALPGKGKMNDKHLHYSQGKGKDEYFIIYPIWNMPA